MYTARYLNADQLRSVFLDEHTLFHHVGTLLVMMQRPSHVGVAKQAAHFFRREKLWTALFALACWKREQTFWLCFDLEVPPSPRYTSWTILKDNVVTKVFVNSVIVAH